MSAFWLWSHWLFKKHDFIYKHLDNSPEKVIVAKRFFCSNIKGNTGCGKTCRVQLSMCIFQLCYIAAIVWKFFSLHCISKKTIQESYEVATQTAKPRNAYRWLNKLQEASSFIKNKIPTPNNFFTLGNSKTALVQYLNTLYPNCNMPAFFQSAHQTKFMNTI